MGRILYFLRSNHVFFQQKALFEREVKRTFLSLGEIIERFEAGSLTMSKYCFNSINEDYLSCCWSLGLHRLHKEHAAHHSTLLDLFGI